MSFEKQKDSTIIIVPMYQCNCGQETDPKLSQNTFSTNNGNCSPG